MTADRRTVRLIAEATALEDISVLSAHLAAVDPRFAAVGRLAEDRQFERLAALRATGFDLPQPEERTATIAGRTYQLPEVTASVVRELCTPAAVLSSANPTPTAVASSSSASLGELLAEQEEKSMPTATTTESPNTALNGPEPSQTTDEGGFLATVKRHCTVRNGVIAGALVLLGSAVYLAVTRGTEVAPTA